MDYSSNTEKANCLLEENNNISLAILVNYYINAINVAIGVALLFHITIDSFYHHYSIR